MDDLTALQERVIASPAAWFLLQADAALPFDDDAHRAAQLRLDRAFDDADDLAHALRGEGLTEEQAHEIASQDRKEWDSLITENNRRETRANREKDAA